MTQSRSPMYRSKQCNYIMYYHSKLEYHMSSTFNTYNMGCIKKSRVGGGWEKGKPHGSRIIKVKIKVQMGYKSRICIHSCTP